MLQTAYTTSVPLRPAAMRGFTAIEWMVVAAIVAVLASLAAPSFTPMIESWRVLQTAKLLQSTLFYARSEAIKRGGQVTIQKIANNSHGCTSASGNRDWDCGWMVCHDLDSDGVCNADEPVLQRVDAPTRVQVTRTGGGASIKFNRWGLVKGSWPGFNLVPLGKNLSHPGARGVCMSSGGRIRVIPQASLPCTAGRP